jgi:hypothetical protein
VPSPAKCAVSPGWSRVNLNHRPHLYRVVSAMAWGVGSSAAAPPTNGNISAVTGSAGAIAWDHLAPVRFSVRWRRSVKCGG